MGGGGVHVFADAGELLGCPVVGTATFGDESSALASAPALKPIIAAKIHEAPVSFMLGQRLTRSNKVDEPNLFQPFLLNSCADRGREC